MLLYVCVTLLSDQPRRAQYLGEQFDLAAGVSHEVYHAPLGSIYWGVLDGFLDLATPVQQTLERAVNENREPGELLTVSPDGNGIGYVIFATAAMSIFGPQISSLLYAFLALLLISSAAFVWRYQDRRLLFIPLYFTALTVLMFTIIGVNPREADNIPIGGIRYFALFAIMPAAHVFLELADVSISGLRMTARSAALLGIQILFLVVAIIIRGSPACLFGAIGLEGLAMIAAHCRKPAALQNVVGKGAYIGALGAALFAIFHLSVPDDYKATGRTMGHLWHRVVISLAFNPAWPFGNLREVYDCLPLIPEGLVRSPMDGIGRCIWFALPRNRHVPEAELAAHIYDGDYEGAMREAFFDIARSYPREVLETFFYYKPMRLLNTMTASLDLYFGGQAVSMVVVLLAQMAMTITFIVLGTTGASEGQPRLLGRMLALFFSWSLLPPFVAWSSPHTSADLILYVFVGIGLVAAAGTERIRRYTRRGGLDPTRA
jgi:hypothetical protein